MTTRLLVVGRDRAHVRELIKLYPCSEVISAASFFDKVSWLPFLYDRELKKDDGSPLVIATDLLARSREYPISWAPKFASLYSAILHGCADPKDLSRLSHERKMASAQALSIAAGIHEAMLKKSLTNTVGALYKARYIMRERKLIPPSLAAYPKILLLYLVDLTTLEIAVIKELGELGLSLELSFPLDFAARGINVAVDFVAKQFECSEGLTNIELKFNRLTSLGPTADLVQSLLIDDEPVIEQHGWELIAAGSINEEAHLIANKIGQLKTKDSRAKIALVLRTIDHRAQIYRRTLLDFGLSLNERKGISLVDSPAGLALKVLLSAGSNQLGRSDLVSLLANPIFRCSIIDAHMRSLLISLIDRLGIDDRAFLGGHINDRYYQPISQYLRLSLSEEQVVLAHQLKNLVVSIETDLAFLAKPASLEVWLKSLKVLVEKCLNADEPSVGSLLGALISLAESQAHEGTCSNIDFQDFTSLLSSYLRTITIVNADRADFDAVELLPLPELLGRSFDYIFIADMAFGRLPQNIPPDPLINDEQRILINQALGRPVLRVFFDDPFEPMLVPPRQALEPFWFACAVASAKKHVYFSYAMRDEAGKEQAAGEFFLWLSDHVRCEQSSERAIQFISPISARFLAGLKHKSVPGLKSEDFKISPELAVRSLAGRLGPDNYRALTPTMIEAFASCRWAGFLSRVIGLEAPQKDHDEVDARLLGQLAHQALERYFLAPKNIDVILRELSQEYCQNNYISSIEVFFCHVEWLAHGLVELITTMKEHQDLAGAIQVGTEISFGLKESAWPALAIHGHQRSYFIGGIIDRLVRTHNGFIVIDYKLSGFESLKARNHSKSLLSTSFQMPIYLSLVKHYLASDQPVSFMFISIRDGQILALDDRSLPVHTSLFEAIDTIFEPVARGEIMASPGEHCQHCDFALICRKSEWARHD